MNFSTELKKLLKAEKSPPVDPFIELMGVQAELLAGIKKKDADLSLQIEEIYAIIKKTDENEKEVKAAVKRESSLLNGFIMLCDLLDDLLPHIGGHSEAVEAKKDEVMRTCGMEPLGFIGERLDPKLHTAASAEYSDAPLECVIRVLQAGYAYRGKVIKKATVILSKGPENK